MVLYWLYLFRSHPTDPFLVLSYSTPQTAVCLDEGQKIRNPLSDITGVCKLLPSFHRLLLSGTPIQNSLQELWSLFDFVYPGRLGALPVFEAEFSVPIRIGGFANASPLQQEIAVRTATTLQQIVRPYLLRRKKDDLKVSSSLLSSLLSFLPSLSMSNLNLPSALTHTTYTPGYNRSPEEDGTGPVLPHVSAATAGVPVHPGLARGQVRGRAASDGVPSYRDVTKGKGGMQGAGCSMQGCQMIHTIHLPTCT